jgi:hypothetical protein
MPNKATNGQLLVGDLIVEDANATNGAPVPRTARVTMTAATGDAGALSWGNPTGGRIIVQSVVIDITTASGATTTIDVGVDADGTGSDDTLIDGKSTATAGVFSSIDDPGTNGRAQQALTSSEFVTGSITGTIGSFAGVAYITYIPA